MSADPPDWTQNAQVGAMAYLLHALLQEAERQNRGFIDQVIEGAVDDHKGIPAGTPDKPFVGDTDPRAPRHAAEVGLVGAEEDREQLA